MTSFRSLFIVFMVVGLFSFAFIQFAVDFQTNNNVNNSILQNQGINKTYRNIQVELNASSSNATSERTAIDSEEVTTGTDSLLLRSIGGAKTVFTGTIMAFWNVVVIPAKTILGVNDAIIGGLGTILVVTVLILGWRVLRSGE